MERIPALRKLLEKRDYMCKIDLKDVYMVVPIHQSPRDFLTFFHRDIVYRYKSLTFGLNAVPRVFPKLMKYAVEPLRKEGIRFVFYLDDICILTRMKEEMKIHASRMISHLQELGFLINEEKSILVPQQVQSFLGFQFNSKEMTIQVPQVKIQKLNTRIRQLLSDNKQRSCRWIASLIRKVTAMIPAIGEALLHVRYLQRDLVRSLRLSHNNWESPCKISVLSIQELKWWLNRASIKNGLPIRRSLLVPDFTICVGASDSGWGEISTSVQTAGFWTRFEKEECINIRELKAILFSPQLHMPRYKNCNLKIYSDNRTALKYINKAGGTASEALQELAIQIQQLCNIYKVQLICHHVPGIQNPEADRLNRRSVPLYEWALPRRWFQQLQRIWGHQLFKIDAFATRHNRKLPAYWSLQPDPEAQAVDAFN